MVCNLTGSGSLMSRCVQLSGSCQSVSNDQLLVQRKWGKLELPLDKICQDMYRKAKLVGRDLCMHIDARS